MKPIVKVTLVIAVMFAAVIPSGVQAQGFAFPNYTWGPFTLHPSVSVGYAASTTPVSLTLDLASKNRINTERFQQKFYVQGIWTELSIPARTSSALGFGVGFGYLFPFNKDSLETYDQGNGQTSREASRSWSTRVQMAKCDLAVTYDISPTVTTILGFRYDSFLVNFKEPQTINDTLGPGIFVGDQSGEFNFVGFLPIVGVMVQRVLSPSQGLRAGFIGFPALVGSFSYRENLFKRNITEKTGPAGGITASKEFMSGYFLEAFTDITVPISSWAQLTVFGKYNGVYGKTPTDVNASTMFPDDKSDDPLWPGRIISSTASFQRSVWFVGAGFSTTFWLW